MINITPLTLLKRDAELHKRCGRVSPAEVFPRPLLLRPSGGEGRTGASVSHAAARPAPPPQRGSRKPEAAGGQAGERRWVRGAGAGGQGGAGRGKVEVRPGRWAAAARRERLYRAAAALGRRLRFARGRWWGLPWSCENLEERGGAGHPRSGPVWGAACGLCVRGPSAGRPSGCGTSDVRPAAAPAPGGCRCGRAAPLRSL